MVAPIICIGIHGRPRGVVFALTHRLHTLLFAVAVLAFALVSASARADVVADWDVTAFDTLKAANIGGNPQVRAVAIMHVAMSDAVNTVQNRYPRHSLGVALNPAASAEAAAVAAARGVLVALVPAQIQSGCCLCNGSRRLA